MASKKNSQPAKPNYQGSLADYKKSIKSTSSKKPRESDTKNEYFIKQGKAYVRLASSGDVMGPYSVRSSAGRNALSSQVAGAIGRAASTLRGGGGLINRGK